MRSTLLLAMLSTAALAQPVVNAQAQTDPLTTGPTSGRDVALWLAPDGGALVLVTNQLATVGLTTYALAGALQQSGSTGPTVSVDVRYGVTALNRTVDLVLLGQQSGGLAPFLLDERGTLTVLAPAISSAGAAPLAMALWRPASGAVHVIASGGTRSLDDFALLESDGILSLSRQRSFGLSGEPRFVRVDDARSLALVTTDTGTLVQLDLSQPQPVAIEIGIPDAGAAPLLGGVAPFSSSDGGLLAVISQPGANRYWVYDVLGGTFVGDFQIKGVGGSGLVSGGLGVSASAAVLPGFPRGVLVVQDPANVTGPNAKLVSLDTLGAAVGFEAAAEDTPRADGGRIATADAGARPDAGIVVGCPVDSDAGALDGGATDAGPCLLADGGARDGGTTVGRPTDPGISVEPDPAKPCGCSQAGLLWPAGLGALLWALRRRR